MIRKLKIILLLVTFNLFYSNIYSNEKIKSKKLKIKNGIDLYLKMGQGGFEDNRSPLNKLGGGQTTLKIKPVEFPFALELSGEYYTNSPEPTNPYEIYDMTLISLFYMKNFGKKERYNFFVGGGIAHLKVPQGEEFKSEKGIGYNFETGINMRLYKILGIYTSYKHLYAVKKKDGIKVINFNEDIILIGLSLKFRLFDSNKK